MDNAMRRLWQTPHKTQLLPNVPTSLFRFLMRSMVTRDEWSAGTERERV